MKLLKKIGSAAASLAFALIFLAGAAMIAVYLSGGGIYAVETASMQSTYPVGSVIVVRKTEPETLVAGDVITYVAKDGHTAVTHRVVENDIDNGQIITKGDMNNTSDSAPALYENVLGKVVFSVPYVGYLLIFSRRKKVRTAIIAALGLILVFYVYCIAAKAVRAARRRRNERCAKEDMGE